MITQSSHALPGSIYTILRNSYTFLRSGGVIQFIRPVKRNPDHLLPTDNGHYKAVLPTEPAGSWTAKAQLEKPAYPEFYLAVERPTSGWRRLWRSCRRLSIWYGCGSRPGETGLDNRHEEDTPAVDKTVVFGKYSYLGETEYNIEFWLSEQP